MKRKTNTPISTTIQILRESGYEINLSKLSVETAEPPLVWAARKLEPAIVQLLIHESDVPQERIEGIKAAVESFYSATLEGEEAIFKLLKEGRDGLTVVNMLLSHEVKIDDGVFFRRLGEKVAAIASRVSQRRRQPCLVKSLEIMRNICSFLSNHRTTHSANMICAVKEGDKSVLMALGKDMSFAEKQEIFYCASELGFYEISQFCYQAFMWIDKQVMINVALSNPVLVNAFVESLLYNGCDEKDERIQAALEISIARDRSDSLFAILRHICIDNLAVRGVPVMVVAYNYLAKECFKVLVNQGAKRFDSYPTRYIHNQEIVPFQRKYERNIDADEEFFVGRGTDSAMEWNLKSISE